MTEIKPLWICERKEHLPEHDGGTGYYYYTPVREYTPASPDAVGELPKWAEFERIEWEEGEISYESHGREGLGSGDTHISIYGIKAKEVSDKIRAALKAQLGE